MAFAAGLADVNVGVVDIADLTDGREAVHADLAVLTGGEADGCHTVFLSHQLSGDAGGADKLSALAGVELDVVDNGTDGDVCQRQSVARLDIGCGGGDDRIADAQADRGEDVAALAVFILAQGDERAAVGVVLETENLCGHLGLVALEVDNAVLLAVAAALVADGDAAVAVAAGVLLEDLDEGLLGLDVLLNTVEAGDGHLTSGRSSRSVSFDRHSLFLLKPCLRTAQCSWSRH